MYRLDQIDDTIIPSEKLMIQVSNQIVHCFLSTYLRSTVIAMAEQFYFYYSLVGLCLFFLAQKVLQYGSRPKTFPPGRPDALARSLRKFQDANGAIIGPPTLPILGNLHQMPTKNFHLEFQKLAQQCKEPGT